MVRERCHDARRRAYLDEFQVLMESDYWRCLPQKTRQAIATMLAEYRMEQEGGSPAAGAS